MPLPTVFAGPNGSGKSSPIKQVNFEGQQNLLEPDAVARRMNPEFPRKAGISAGQVLRRTREYIRREESFAIETTLAGGWTNSAIMTALERSFFVRLFYVCVDNPGRSIQRVRQRVAQGGHDVADSDIRRRYGRSIANAGPILRIVDQGLVFDNSGPEPRPVFEMRKGKVFHVAEEVPAWAAGLLA